MASHPRSGLSVVVFLALGIAGCPASTTLGTDGGGSGSDGGGGGIDAGGGATDGGGSTTDTGGPLVDGGGGTDAGGGTGPWGLCNVRSDCTLAYAGCCAPCGVPTLDDYDAIAIGTETQHTMDVCPVPTPCPRCATQLNPYLVATCGDVHCGAVDLSAQLGQCNVDADCVVRWANCCSCSGTEDQVIALHTGSDGARDALLCDGGTCPTDCVTQGDSAFFAYCEPTTHLCAARRIMR